MNIKESLRLGLLKSEYDALVAPIKFGLLKPSKELIKYLDKLHNELLPHYKELL